MKDIRKVFDFFNGQRWMLSGSAALQIRGLTIEVNDYDVIVPISQVDRKRILDRATGYIVNEVYTPFNGLEILLEDFTDKPVKIHFDRLWSFEGIEYISYKNLRIPCKRLKAMSNLYKRMSLLDKAELVDSSL